MNSRETEMENMINTKMSREQRITMRRQRIRNRRNKEDSKFKGSKTMSEVESVQTSKAKTQVQASRDHIDDVRSDGWALVTDIRVDADAREALRRREEEARRKDRIKLVENEIHESMARNAAIESNWDVLQSATVPQDLWKEFQLQQVACNQVISSKDALIKEFHAELKNNDDNYVKLLKQQQEDIASLLDRMHEQFALMQNTYAQELNAIENAYIEERKALIAANKKVLDSLFDRRRSMEMHIIESKLQREEKFARELEDLRVRDGEEYNKLKMNLEHNIQLLEQQLEEMRATYQLNAEKLEYNFRVLKARDLENRETVTNQKNKLKRSKEALTKLKERFLTLDQKFKNENAELTEEYARIAEQFKDLQRKFRHFEAIDKKKYDQVWSMNEEKVMQVGHKVLQADKIIHEQILGLDWTPPPPEYFTLDYDPAIHGAAVNVASSFPSSIPSSTFSSATIPSSLGAASSSSAALGGSYVLNMLSELGVSWSDALHSSAHSAPANQVRGGAHSAGSKPPVSTTPRSSSANPNSTSDFQSSSTTNNQSNNPPALRRGKFTPIQIRQVLDLLVSEASFLTDQATNIPQDTPAEERNMLIADAILKALGVEDREDLEELVALFYAEGDEGQSGTEPIVHPNDTIKVVRQYVLDRQQAKNAPVGGTVKSDTVSKEKRDRQRGKERAFWKRLEEVVPERTYRVWAALETSLHKYNDVLENRSTLLDETLSLQNQNEELKNLLKRYLSSKDNELLQVPPSQVIRLGASGALPAAASTQSQLQSAPAPQAATNSTPSKR